MTPRHRVRLATGIEVSYLESGDPASLPLVLVHAWVESAASFDRLVPLLPEAVRVCALDLRGHGSSDKPTGGHTLAQIADDAVAFLDSLGTSAAVLLGSSSGGYVAQ